MKFFAEQSKIQLSFNEKYDILTDVGEIPGQDDDGEEFELDFTISRDDFRKAVEPIFQQAIDNYHIFLFHLHKGLRKF